MPLYNSVEYSDNYSKTLGSLWQFYKDESFLDNDGAIYNGVIDCLLDKNNSASFKFKTKKVDRTGNDGTKDIIIIVPPNNLSNCWRTLEMSLTNCEKNLILTYSGNCFIMASLVNDQVATFAAIDTKLYVPVVLLSTQDNAKLLDQWMNLSICLYRY